MTPEAPVPPEAVVSSEAVVSPEAVVSRQAAVSPEPAVPPQPAIPPEPAVPPEVPAPSASAHPDRYSCAQAWARLTAAHARIADRLASALARSCGLSINDFEVLLRLDPVPPPGLRLGELRSVVRLTQPSLSREVARLEDRGWLDRADVPDDGRGVLVSITADGRDVLRRAVPVHAQTIREFLLDPLTPGELDLLARALGRVADTDGPSPER
jgi:DNA-binding MarR family transcriptional regulator